MPQSENAAPAPRRRLLRISLRSAMILIVVFAAWLGVKVHRARTQARSVARIEDAGGIVRYDPPIAGADPPGDVPAPRIPGWVRRSIGEDYFREVTRVSLFATRAHPAVTDDVVSPVASLDRLSALNIGDTWKVTDAGLANVSGLTRLRELSLTNMRRITDLGMVHLAGLTGLRKLTLDLDGITDAGLAHIAHLRGLRELNLSGDRLTGAALAHLEGLEGLQTLRIGGVRWESLENDDLSHLAHLTGLRELSVTRQPGITAAGLRHLRGLRRLRRLDLSGTWVSTQAAADLRAEIPGLTVVLVGRPSW